MISLGSTEMVDMAQSLFHQECAVLGVIVTFPRTLVAAVFRSCCLKAQ